MSWNSMERAEAEALSVLSERIRLIAEDRGDPCWLPSTDEALEITERIPSRKVLLDFLLWIRVAREAGYMSWSTAPFVPSAADISKSALFERLRSGKPPLPEPPPLGYACPWYALVEDAGPHNVFDAWVREDSSREIVVLQNAFEIVGESVEGGYKVHVVRDMRHSTSYRFRLWHVPTWKRPGGRSSVAGAWFMQNLVFPPPWEARSLLPLAGKMIGMLAAPSGDLFRMGIGANVFDAFLFTLASGLLRNGAEVCISEESHESVRGFVSDALNLHGGTESACEGRTSVYDAVVVVGGTCDARGVRFLEAVRRLVKTGVPVVLVSSYGGACRDIAVVSGLLPVDGTFRRDGCDPGYESELATLGSILPSSLLVEILCLPEQPVRVAHEVVRLLQRCPSPVG